MAARYGPIDRASAAPVDSMRIPARGAPSRYPGVQKNTIRAIDAAADCGATTATAVGRPTKKLPFAHPLTRAKINNGGKDVLTGHIASILTEFTKQVMIMVLKAPILSHVQPPRIRPTAVAAPKPPTKAAPIEGESPIELAKSGKKNGGTKSANTPIAPAMAKVRKDPFLKSDQSNLESPFVAERSLMTKAHGMPVTIMSIPKIRKVHSSPNLSMSACAASGKTVAPTPPPALTRPLARPSFALNHCRGRLFVAVYNSAVPTPTKTPATQNRPPRLCKVKLVATNPSPNTIAAASTVY